jgi:hypothetical protein
MPKVDKTQEVNDTKIRQAIWYLKTGKTKKFVCEFLSIAYNTKKLDKLIEDFRNKEQREKDLKSAAKTKVFTQAEKRSIVDAYLSGDSQSGIAAQYYVSPQRIKNILIETNTPIRGRGKNSQATVDHIKQDLEVKFNKKDKVFIAKYNCMGTISEIYDENYLEQLENGRQRYQETYPFKPNKFGFDGKHCEPVEGVHYEIYWQTESGIEIKLSAMKNIRNRIIKTLEETGRESYLVWREDDQGGFYYFNRDSLYPVRKV